MEFSFVGIDGKAVDTVIFAGENGCGKSTIIDFDEPEISLHSKRKIRKYKEWKGEIPWQIS